MNIKQWKKLLDSHYYKDNQRLLFETCLGIKLQKRRKQYHSQRINYKDSCLIEIETFNCYKYASALGSIPYCKRSEWGNWLITVPKFGQLTNKDIYKAIGYVLRQIDAIDFWNICLDDKFIDVFKFHNYEQDTETLRGFLNLGINDEN